MDNKGMIIVGAGIVGIGIAFYLVTRKATDVLNPPASQGNVIKEEESGYIDNMKRIEAGQLTEPTKVTYNQNLLNQPLELEGVTWMKGIIPQDSPDKYWEDTPEIEGESPDETEVKKQSVTEPFEYSDAIMHTANLVPLIPTTVEEEEAIATFVTNLASDESGAWFDYKGEQH